MRRLRGASGMECRSCLNETTSLVVADTSVAINLNATGFSGTILDALPNQFAIVEEVAVELREGRRNGHNDADALNALVAGRRAEIVRLGNPGIQIFIELASGPAAQTLDDGEAATIAYALEHSATALVDERKANRICAERFRTLATGYTVDLLAHTEIEAALGRSRLSDAVFNALHHGRMRVPAHYVDWVVDLIGSDRVARCTSLPSLVRPRREPAPRGESRGSPP